jgi:hypothetical protein
MGFTRLSFLNFRNLADREIGVAVGAERGGDAEEVHGLEEIGLSLAVLTDQQHPSGRDADLPVRQVAEVQEGESGEPHQSNCMGMMMLR